MLIATCTVTLVALIAVGGCHGWVASTKTTAGPPSMWQTLEKKDPAISWRTIFGERGERGEYMDGYTEQSMAERCRDDYGWRDGKFRNASVERAAMMSHLYDSDELWDYVSMVAFAEHYVLSTDHNVTPFGTFSRHKRARPPETPIFGGVVWSNWSLEEARAIEKLEKFAAKGIDYVRMECNFGSSQQIGGVSGLAYEARFDELALSAKRCQELEMVPVLLLQLPWRDTGSLSKEYFEEAMYFLADALDEERVEPESLILETRPPIGLSSPEERALSGTERTYLGLATGRNMFDSIRNAFDDHKIAAFCIAGGSTKGDVPTAMEDDTQNGVRQGMRQCARQQWGFDLCFWEMGAKLMLQPKVGRLWGRNTQSGRDAARELFCLNAQDLTDEIKVPIGV